MLLQRKEVFNAQESRFPLVLLRCYNVRMRAFITPKKISSFLVDFQEVSLAPTDIFAAEYDICRQWSSSQAIHNFIGGRYAARRALRAHGSLQDEPLQRDEKTSRPLWPAGYCGSISHTNDAAIAAAAFENDYASIGIDIEHPRRDMTDAALEKICSPAELKWVFAAAREKRERAIQIFTAKESIYKALSPLLPAVTLGFHDAECVIESDIVRGADVRGFSDREPYSSCKLLIYQGLHAQFCVSLCVIHKQQQRK